MAQPAPDSLVNGDDGRRYWDGINADVNGMLGGFSSITRVDLQGSRSFLAKLGIGTKKDRRVVQRALEGGAGYFPSLSIRFYSIPIYLSFHMLTKTLSLDQSIGRVTQGMLVNVAETVDVIEPIAKFTANLADKPGVGTVFNMGLEEWTPSPTDVKYGLVWIQWCAGHLSDAQLVEFLKRCKGVLVPDSGVIVVKENLASGIEDVFDKVDSSVTRRESKFRDIFERAGLRIVKTELQNGLLEASKENLFPVRMFALKPAVAR
ncbi:protein N-terminal methyltransferase [Geosmithia morbida]|uniref:Alpha N-terminal protein methyltransferase 1 n=1 Tax=Geosmithia morbida TaxID=1094350 RepID=A0A9P4YTF6_9HYPO|nr:protein N-terminal methyltransferase [Geosmithia morbida]KAF4121492.1 protein N-terminal methyltransferase [Geosmithia morbida]